MLRQVFHIPKLLLIRRSWIRRGAYVRWSWNLTALPAQERKEQKWKKNQQFLWIILFFNLFSVERHAQDINVTTTIIYWKDSDRKRIKCLAMGHLYHLNQNVFSAIQLIYIGCHDWREKLLWRSGTTICYSKRVLHRILVEGNALPTIMNKIRSNAGKVIIGTFPNPGSWWSRTRWISLISIYIGWVGGIQSHFYRESFDWTVLLGWRRATTICYDRTRVLRVACTL